MISQIKIFLLLILLTALVGLGTTARAQDRDNNRLSLKKNATYQETVDWLKFYWFPYVGIGVDDRIYPKNAKTSRAFAFFKGFKLTGSENCVLTLRNEGNYQDAAKTRYLVEATIPLSDLGYEKASVGSRPSSSPSIDEGYGVWGGKFVSKKYDLNFILDVKEPEKKTYSGSILNFTFQTKEGAMTFSKVFLQLIKKCQN